MEPQARVPRTRDYALRRAAAATNTSFFVAQARERAAACLDEAVRRYSEWLPLPPRASRLAIVAKGHGDQARWAEQLAALKETVDALPM